MIGGAVLALIALRVLIDEPLTWRDAVAVATMAIVYPFGEWAIHVYLLHAKPITLRGRTFELPTTRDHRYHHRHPNNLFTLLLNAEGARRAAAPRGPGRGRASAALPSG